MKLFSEETTGPDGQAASLELLAKVDRMDGVACGDCGNRVCGHQTLFSIALGIADRPLCLPCLAHSVARDPAELRDHLLQHFRHRACYAAVWEIVTQRETRGKDRPPECGWSETTMTNAPPADGGTFAPATTPDSSLNAVPQHVEWDAGNLACGDLLLQLRQRVRSLPPSSVLVLISRDPGAVEDIPAWCRLTGNRLLSQEYPCYRIERRVE